MRLAAIPLYTSMFPCIIFYISQASDSHIPGFLLQALCIYSCSFLLSSLPLSILSYPDLIHFHQQLLYVPHNKYCCKSDYMQAKTPFFLILIVQICEILRMVIPVMSKYIKAHSAIHILYIFRAVSVNYFVSSSDCDNPGLAAQNSTPATQQLSAYEFSLFHFYLISCQTA